MTEPEHPIVRFRGIMIAGVFMPLLVGVAWWKASDFDPYTSSFFTKTYIEPTPGMPDEFRMAGWVFIGLGALLLAAVVNGLWRKRTTLREMWLLVWMGLLVMAFGGAFFVAADRAETAIAARGNGR